MQSGDNTEEAPPRRKHRATGRRARVVEARRLGQARHLHDQGAFAAADTLYARILTRNPANLAALRGRAEAAVARSQTAPTDTGNDGLADDLSAIADECYARGLYEEAGSLLYVNRGVGVAGPAVRVNCSREVATLELQQG